MSHCKRIAILTVVTLVRLLQTAALASPLSAWSAWRSVEGLSGVSYRIQCYQYNIRRLDIWLSDGATPPKWQRNPTSMARGTSYIYRDCWLPAGPDAAGRLKFIFQNFTAN